tara:strand:+ start:219 stop:572 length:354 start_codon:yes stop_codon:yes gene_type:complete
MPTLPKGKDKPWIVSREQNKPGSRAVKSHNEMMYVYNTQQWKATRAYHIQRNPICLTCKTKDNRVVAGDVVDHIIPIRQGGDPFQKNNLQTLCHPCHNKKSRQEKDSITYTKGTMYR